MKTYLNNQGEQITKWESNIHPDNSNFMQKVFWMMVEKPNGKISVGYNLGSNSKTKWIFNLTKDEILEKFVNK